MANTSKSPKRILLQVAHELGKRRLHKHWHKFSPKKFTVPQLFACLVLKEFMRLDYRKLSALLTDAPELAAVIGWSACRTSAPFKRRRPACSSRVV